MFPYFFVDYWYIVLVMPTVILSLWASHSKFAGLYIKYSRPGIVSGFRNIDSLREKISPYLFVKTKSWANFLIDIVLIKKVDRCS